MKKRIVLCADDYGQALSISTAIISLIQADRLAATSCLVNTQDWPLHASWLRPWQAKIEIGLHFNLTEGPPLAPRFQQTYGSILPSLKVLLWRAYARQLDQAAIEAECHAQLDQFQAAMGCLPNYIDGHQHVHQFPVIRSALLNVYKQRFPAKSAYIRVVNPSWKVDDVWRDPKKLLLRLLGARALEARLKQEEIIFNQSFAGIYDFKPHIAYAHRFRQFLQQSRNDGIIMCHPGTADSNSGDVIAAARYQEYLYLSSEQFLKDCDQQQVVITKFNRD